MSPLSGTNWQLITLGPEWLVNPVDNLTLTFDLHGYARGFTGCNIFSADYQTNNGRINFGNLTVTERACSEPIKIDQERNYLEALTQAKVYTLYDGEQRLIITGPDGKKPLGFQRTQ